MSFMILLIPMNLVVEAINHFEHFSNVWKYLTCAERDGEHLTCANFIKVP